MQYKKEEMKNSILEHAEREFIEKGFEKASIRNIVKSAGTTIGNFYNYFDNKESLFEELVLDEYNKFIYFIKHHDEIERPDYLWEKLNITECRRVLKELIINFLPIFTDKFILLVESSKGTKYENARSILNSYLEEHFIEHMQQHSSQYIESTTFSSLIARQFLDGVVIILKENKDPDERRALLTEHILFYFLGTMGLLGESMTK